MGGGINNKEYKYFPTHTQLNLFFKIFFKNFGEKNEKETNRNTTSNRIKINNTLHKRAVFPF